MKNMEENTMKRAAIYARVSTEHQTQTSLETQVKTCRNFCQQQGWVLSMMGF